MAQLPEGFCPASMQELANAIAERLVVSPNQAFTSFATGSVEPSSNVGPWLKDCLQWFFFDDATARYKIQPKGGFDTMDYRTTSGTFTVPDNIFKLKVTAFGGGGGGHSSSAGTPGGAGGGGSSGISIVTVTPGQSISFTIGAGGAGGTPGAAGGSTTVLGLTAGGGAGASSLIIGGLGGTATGFTINLSGQSGCASTGGAQALDTAGGDAGGWGGKGGVTRENASPTGRNGTTPGGGGSGAGTGASTTVGNGADGAILFEY